MKAYQCSCCMRYFSDGQRVPAGPMLEINTIGHWWCEDARCQRDRVAALAGYMDVRYVGIVRRALHEHWPDIAKYDAERDKALYWFNVLVDWCVHRDADRVPEEES